MRLLKFLAVLTISLLAFLPDAKSQTVGDVPFYIPYCDQGEQIYKVFFKARNRNRTIFVDENLQLVIPSADAKGGFCADSSFLQPLSMDLQKIKIEQFDALADTFTYCRTLDFNWSGAGAGSFALTNPDGSTVTIPAGLDYSYPISTFQDTVIIDATAATGLYISSDCRGAPCLNQVELIDCVTSEPLEGWQTNGVFWGTGGLIWQTY